MAVSDLHNEGSRSAELSEDRVQRLEERLARIEIQVERGNREGRNAGRAFTIFAVAALGLAMVTLFAVLADDDGGPAATTITTRGPMMGAATPAATAAAPAPAARDIAVTLREYSVAAAPAVGGAGRVHFAVRNAGAITHEFVVVRTDKPAGALLKGREADETGNVGEIGDLPPGSAKTLTLPLKAGHYALICNLPGHYAAGQHTDFTVR